MEPATLESGNAIPLLRTLGIVLTEIGERHAVMEVVVEERHGNYLGGAHGGLIATLVDTVCFFPRPLLPAARLVTTTNLNITYVRPAMPGDRLIARSELVHLGRRMASLTARVTDGEGRLVAHGSISLMVLQEPEGGQAGSNNTQEGCRVQDSMG
ncbi:MAG TPA: PaaI family thioesterase [Geobacteraceae bacterium]